MPTVLSWETLMWWLYSKGSHSSCPRGSSNAGELMPLPLPSIIMHIYWALTVCQALCLVLCGLPHWIFPTILRGGYYYPMALMPRNSLPYDTYIFRHYDDWGAGAGQRSWGFGVGLCNLTVVDSKPNFAASWLDGLGRIQEKKPMKSTGEAQRSEVTKERKTDHLKEGKFYPWLAVRNPGTEPRRA